jgi:hypothetical protein
MVTIAFIDEAGDVENMHAMALPDGIFRLENIPFHAHGISFGDEFRVKVADGRLFFDEVTRRGGHSTYRLRLPGGVTHEQFLKLWQPFAKEGCSFEGSSAGQQPLYALDIPRGVDVHAVYEKLAEGEDRGLWEFEEGHYGGSN